MGIKPITTPLLALSSVVTYGMCIYEYNAER